MTFNIYYTDRAQPDSSFINRVWYDAKGQRMALELHGNVYEYNNVPPFVYDSLVGAESPGNYYRSNVKGPYGPGSYLGSAHNAREMKVTFTNVLSLDKAREQRGLSGKPFGDLRLVPDNDRSAGQLKFHNGGTFTSTGKASIPHLSLVKDVPASDVVEYDHTIYFTVGTSDDEKTHTLKADSMDSALDAMFALAEKLDQDIEVKGVLVRFE